MARTADQHASRPGMPARPHRAIENCGPEVDGEPPPQAQEAAPQAQAALEVIADPGLAQELMILRGELEELKLQVGLLYTTINTLLATTRILQPPYR